MPAAITIAVLRYQLLDIRLVVSRALLYGLLTAGVVGSYLGLVAVADLALRRGNGLGSSVLATLLIALGFNPVRVRLQRLVDRALFGDRSDPVQAVSRLGERLGSGPQADPADGLAVVREALRLPYAAAIGVDLVGLADAYFGRAQSGWPVRTPREGAQYGRRGIVAADGLVVDGDHPRAGGQAADRAASQGRHGRVQRVGVGPTSRGRQPARCGGLSTCWVLSDPV